MNIMVLKRNGKKEKFDFNKIYKHLNYAIKDLKNVDINKIISNLKIHLKNEISSEEIQKSLYIVVSNFEEEEYQYAAARLLLQDYYKKIHKSFNPKFDLKKFKERIEKGYYDDEIFNYYDEKELEEFFSKINYENDKKFTYLGLTQILKKYAIKNNGEAIELPQEIFMLISIYGFARIKDKKLRKKFVLDFYNALSNFDIFLPTPDMAGFRTPLKGFTSCAGINFGDSIESIGNGSKSMFHLITKLRAGIGANWEIRGINAKIRNGAEKHTGIIPYVKTIESISKSSTQPSNGRSGAVTNYYPFFHWEIFEILELKNNKGSEEFRARHSDHAIVFDDLIYERAKNDEDITLFHLNEVPLLYESMGTKYFKKLYKFYEENVDEKHKKKIKAKNLLFKYYFERYTTSRIYKVNANNFKNNSSYNLRNLTSNLCTEISLPSIPDEEIVFYVKNNISQKDFEKIIENYIQDGTWELIYMYSKIIKNKNKNKILEIAFNDFERKIIKDFEKKYIDINSKNVVTYNFGLIFSCILGGINFGNLPKNVEKRRKFFYKNLNLLIRFLDEKIDYQNYEKLKYFEKFTKEYRALGISPGNLFYYLAKNNLELGKKETLENINEIMEEFKFYALKVSNELAKEKGSCKRFKDSKYSKLELINYNKNVDKIVKNKLNLDWEKLKEDIKKFGLRNTALLTAVPSSNSSRPANMISGINPPKQLIYVVEDNSVKINGILPKLKKYEDFYKKHLAFEIDLIEYWKLIAVIQKWIDQSISLNEYVDFTKFDENKLPIEEVIKRDLFGVKYGIKTLYYVIVKSKNFEKDDLFKEVEETNCSGGGCTL